MVQRHGMRKGISIVEMMVAVVIFGVISTIGYKYAKNFYDVSLTSKQALVAAVVDQATQLSNAYDIYETKKGVIPSSIDDLSAADTQILKSTPEVIPAISDGWVLRDDLEIDGDGDADDVAFTYPVNQPSTDTEKQLYCNVLNNIANNAWDYNSSYNSTNDADSEEINDANGMYSKNNFDFKKLMCYGTDSSTFFFAFVQKLN